LRVQEFLQARSLQPKSRKAYQRDLDLFMTWTDTAWNQVTRRQVAQFKQSLLDERRLAPNSVNRTLQTLKSFFKWLVRSEYVSTDPTTEIQQEHVPEPQSQELEAEEVERIIWQLSNGAGMSAIGHCGRLAAWTQSRGSLQPEMWGLCWGRISDPAGEAAIVRAKCP
jgi:site-specific recombinase XerD